MEIKRIVVCGDSFCSVEPKLPGTHFSELLNKQFGYEIINLARPGTSNTNICFQIEEAIKLNADFVIFADTDVSRIDIPVRPYQAGLGIKNFDSNTYSNTIASFVDGRPDVAEKFLNYEDIKTAIKYYINFLFDYSLRAETNEWMIKYWTFELKERHIKYLWINRDSMWDRINLYFKNYPDRIGLVTYHTDVQTQELLADSIKKYIDNL